MNIHTVTLSFADAADAKWFAKCAAASVKTHARLDACRAGIMQDSIAQAYQVVCDSYPVGHRHVRVGAETPIEYAAWETDGGTTAEQNEARFNLKPFNAGVA